MARGKNLIKTSKTQPKTPKRNFNKVVKYLKQINQPKPSKTGANIVDKNNNATALTTKNVVPIIQTRRMKAKAVSKCVIRMKCVNLIR